MRLFSRTRFSCALTFNNLPYIRKKSNFFLAGFFFFTLSLPLKIINKMLSLQMYRVRVLSSDINSVEIIESCSSYSEAVERFLFYVHLALEFSLSVRCVNIFKGKKCINLFTNH